MRKYECDECGKQFDMETKGNMMLVQITDLVTKKPVVREKEICVFCLEKYK